MNNIPQISIGSVLKLKKSHPCGCNSFTVARVGSDVKIICNGCNRALTLDRVKLEKMIKNVILGGNKNEQ